MEWYHVKQRTEITSFRRIDDRAYLTFLLFRDAIRSPPYRRPSQDTYPVLRDLAAVFVSAPGFLKKTLIDFAWARRWRQHKIDA